MQMWNWKRGKPLFLIIRWQKGITLQISIYFKTGKIILSSVIFFSGELLFFFKKSFWLETVEERKFLNFIFILLEWWDWHFTWAVARSDWLLLVWAGICYPKAWVKDQYGHQSGSHILNRRLHKQKLFCLWPFICIYSTGADHMFIRYFFKCLLHVEEVD